MKNHTSKITRQRSVGAFTLIECLLGLAISAVLMVALAVAFNASVTSYGENEDLFWAIHNARQALARMTSQIRNAGYLWEYESGKFKIVAVDPSDPNNRCSFRTADGGDFTFEFRVADQGLYLIDNDPTTGGEYVLCNHVTEARFLKTPTDDDEDSKSVQISLTVESGHTRRTLSAAAVVRRNLGS